MLNQYTTVILAAIIAAIASLLGSLVGGVALPYFTHRLNSKAGNRKLIREKVEEMYILADQVSVWLTKQFLFLGSGFIQQPLPSIKPPEDGDNPINRLLMLAVLYAPSLEKYVMELRNATIAIREIYCSLQTGKNTLTSKEMIDKLMQASESADKEYEELVAAIKRLIKKLS